jgi:hypothetical protein
VKWAEPAAFQASIAKPTRHRSVGGSVSRGQLSNDHNHDTKKTATTATSTTTAPSKTATTVRDTATLW